MCDTSGTPPTHKTGPLRVSFRESSISVSRSSQRTSSIDPIVILSGSHIGCTEVFGNNHVRSTPELKGKTVAVSKLRSDEHLFISIFAAYVGLNPQTDINWVVRPHIDDVRLLTAGKIDAFMAGPPASLETIIERGSPRAIPLPDGRLARCWGCRSLWCTRASIMSVARRCSAACADAE
jgi:hypothetical protein